MTARALDVVACGPQTTVQDLGRPGLGRYAVGRSGAFDRAALRLANRLVGNEEGQAGLECTAGGLSLRAASATTVAVTGALGPLAVVRGAAVRSVDRGGPVSLEPGDVLELGVATAGLRAYVAVRGGLAVPAVLGSRAYDTLAALGPPPLAPGDRLPVGPAAGPAPAVDHVPPDPTLAPGLVLALRIVPGPRAERVGPDTLRILLASEYEVGARSDRVGLRLLGPSLRTGAVRGSAGGTVPADERSTTSEPMLRGALQVPPDGRPVLLGPDHPTTGGYPVVAVVRDADTDRCGQLRPGDRVRFLR